MAVWALVRIGVEQGRVSVEDPLQSQTAGRGGEHRGPGLWLPEQAVEILHPQPAATHVEQGPDHSADLISEEPLPDEVNVESLSPRFGPDSVQGPHRGHLLGHGERRHVAAPGQESCRAGEGPGARYGRQGGRPQTRPGEVRSPPPDAIGVVFSQRAAASVERTGGRHDTTDSNVARQQAVDPLQDAGHRNLHRHVGVCDLARGVDTCVGPSCPDHGHLDPAREGGQGTLQLALYSSIRRLPLPSVKSLSEKGHGQLYSLSHPEYPRTGGIRNEVAAVGSVMIGLMVQLTLGSVMLFSPELSYFPGSYFDSNGRNSVQRRAMEKWPGASKLADIWWNDPNLAKPGRMAILIGAAATHDTDLIPVYRDAVERRSQPIRQAATYGYFDLLGDQLPNVEAGVTDAMVRGIIRDMNRMRISLQRNSLVEVWLHAMLRDEGKKFPGFRGYSPQRSATDCLFAVERVMSPDDLESLTIAFEVSENKISRIGLMRLIEAVTLSRFVDAAVGPRSGSGPRGLDLGITRLEEAIESWQGPACDIDVDRVLKSRMAAMGVTVNDPRGADACLVWQRVLRVGDPTWWPTAAKQLYACGGPWIELSVLQADAQWNNDRRDALLEWYGLMPRVPDRSPRPVRTAPPTVQ